MFLENTLENYLERLASHAPTPGGGSASALVGALGCALLSMVTHYTLAKEDLNKHEMEMKGLLAELERRRGLLQKLTEKDAEVYGMLNNTFKLPKNTEEEKKYRTLEIQKALKSAAEIPLEITTHCHAVIKKAVILCEKGNSALISDIGVGVIFLQAAFQGAALNIETNLKYIKDDIFKHEVRNQYEETLRECESLAKTILETIERAIIK